MPLFVVIAMSVCSPLTSSPPFEVSSGRSYEVDPNPSPAIVERKGEFGGKRSWETRSPKDRAPLVVLVSGPLLPPPPPAVMDIIFVEVPIIPPVLVAPPIGVVMAAPPPAAAAATPKLSPAPEPPCPGSLTRSVLLGAPLSFCAFEAFAVSSFVGLPGTPTPWYTNRERSLSHTNRRKRWMKQKVKPTIAKQFRLTCLPCGRRVNQSKAKKVVTGSNDWSSSNCFLRTILQLLCFFVSTTRAAALLYS